jgi:transcriptional regulator with XRE-family HTH domain
MWEAGKSEPTVQRLEDISKVLGHSFEWFASGETDNRTIHVKKIKLRVDRLSDNSLDVLDEFLTTLERAT